MLCIIRVLPGVGFAGALVYSVSCTVWVRGASAAVVITVPCLTCVIESTPRAQPLYHCCTPVFWDKALGIRLGKTSEL